MSKEKVLYVAPFYDGTGYANAAIATALGLDAAGVDICCKTVKMCPQVILPDPRIMELEGADIGYPTHVIQNWLPLTFFYVKGAKNIGYFFCETTHFKPSSWQYYLNLMDEVWVSCQENYEACLASGVKKPIKIVPIPYVASKINNRDTYRREASERFGHLKKNNKYLFYTIGDYSSRKNIKELIRVYFETFTKADSVGLVIKSFVEGHSGPESNKIISEDIKELKQSLRRFSVDAYPSVYLITDYFLPDDIYRLHAACDCYVSLEKGAAWNIPAFESMLFGNFTIVNGWGGQNQFINNKNGRLLSYQLENVAGMKQCTYPGLYTSYEKWAQPSTSEASNAMKYAYTYRIRNIDNSAELAQYSPNAAGLVLRSIL